MVLTLEADLDPTISQTRYHGFRGTPVGIPQISGMKVEWAPEAELGNRVRRVAASDKPFRLRKTHLRIP